MGESGVLLPDGKVMPQPPQYSLRNRLLGAMSPRDFGLLGPNLEPVVLELRFVLVEPNEAIEHVCFIETGLASVIAISSDGQKLEVGHVGREGMSGASLINGVDRTPNQTFMQMPGSGLRLAAGELAKAMDESLSLRALFLRFMQASLIQVAHSALANGRYNIQERLARWLLMCHDRADGDDLLLTHEFLSLMLGVRRSGVTEALHVLEGMQVVRASRGRVHVLDRVKLEGIAGGCYGLPEAEYKRLVG